MKLSNREFNKLIRNTYMKKIVMTKSQAVKEHKELVGVLKNPTSTKLANEASKQSKELKQYKKK
jgi:hypothetical protein